MIHYAKYRFVIYGKSGNKLFTITTKRFIFDYQREFCLQVLFNSNPDCQRITFEAIELTLVEPILN